MNSAERHALLELEYTRPEPPGLRKFSAGILTLYKQIGGPAPDPKASQAGELVNKDALLVCYLLDQRHSLDEIRAAGAQGPSFLESQAFRDYPFAVPPALLAASKAELAIATRAILAAQIEIEPKPGAKPEGTPKGNS